MKTRDHALLIAIPYEIYYSFSFLDFDGPSQALEMHSRAPQNPGK
jgi:hypothetical protein